MIKKPTYDELYQKVYAAEVHQLIDLAGPWKGWKIRGQYLVAPNKERIPVRELHGLVMSYRLHYGHYRPTGVQRSGPSNVVIFMSAAAAHKEPSRSRPEVAMVK